MEAYSPFGRRRNAGLKTAPGGLYDTQALCVTPLPTKEGDFFELF